MSFKFEIKKEDGMARVGTISTPHGEIQTPTFIPVGTKATVKSVLPEAMRDLGSQAILANAYHLYLQPGPDILDEAGGVAKFMNWNGPTVTDSGGFQVLSLGVGFKKVLAMNADTFRADDVIADNKERLAHVDDEGVTFKSHLDGSMHRFTPEISMQIQHKIGADIMFAFDECTTLHNTRGYQKKALARTHAWAIRCLDEHKRLTELRHNKPFDCVLASRIARTSAVYTMQGRFNVSNGPHRREFIPIDENCDCYTCQNYTRAYLNHLFRAKEMAAATLATIHNERFIVRLVDQMRVALLDGTFQELKREFLGRYQHKSGQASD
ncbi:MAG: tRNA-guanine transglycosylase [Actinobacteria bacterium]|nr:tRNA-guanine transglycosylase [Actinomycetota bacterium]